LTVGLGIIILQGVSSRKSLAGVNITLSPTWEENESHRIGCLETPDVLLLNIGENYYI
jgi:hypothetical protein